MKMKIKSLFSLTSLIIISAIVFTSCGGRTPLLSDLGTAPDKVVSIILQNNDGESVEVTDTEDLARFNSYTKSEKMPAERELEIFDDTNYTLCTVVTSDNKEIAFYIWNTGEIICSLGDNLDTDYYIYTAENSADKADSAYIEDMFNKYR